MLRNAGIDGLSKQPNALCTGLNGGYQAFGLAIAAGGSPIVLVGYDMNFPGGRTHWHDGHQIPVTEQMYKNVYAKYFNSLELPAGLQVFNTCKTSSITKFPKVTLESLL